MGARLGVKSTIEKHRFDPTKYQPGRLHLTPIREGFAFVQVTTRHQKSHVSLAQPLRDGNHVDSQATFQPMHFVYLG